VQVADERRGQRRLRGDRGVQPRLRLLVLAREQQQAPEVERALRVARLGGPPQPALALGGLGGVDQGAAEQRHRRRVPGLRARARPDQGGRLARLQQRVRELRGVRGAQPVRRRSPIEPAARGEQVEHLPIIV
jgi:hypothetical protein